MRSKKLRCGGCLLILLVLMLTGCWDRREVNEVAIVTAVAIDLMPDEQVRITVLLLKPKALSAAGAQQTPVLEAEATGRTVFEAIRAVRHHITRPAEWKHNSLIVLGERAARSGVSEVLDFFVRDHESRLDPQILVTRGEAGPVLSTRFEFEPNAGRGLTQTLRSAARDIGTVPATHLHDFILSLYSQTTSAWAGIVEPAPPESRRGAETANPMRVGGAAVFRKDRLAGWLGETETRGVHWLRGDVTSGIIPVPCRNGEGRGIGVEVLGSDAKITPKWSGGRLPDVRVRVDVFAKLGDLMCREDMGEPDTFTVDLARRTAAVITGEANAALRALQQGLQADPIGIGEALNRAYPQQMRGWEANWDKVFPALKVTADVTVHMTQLGPATGQTLPAAPGR